MEFLVTQDEMLGELAFGRYWEVIEEHCRGVVKAPKFRQMSLAEQQAWGEVAKAVEEQVRVSLCVSSSR